LSTAQFLSVLILSPASGLFCGKALANSGSKQVLREMKPLQAFK